MISILEIEPRASNSLSPVINTSALPVKALASISKSSRSRMVTSGKSNGWENIVSCLRILKSRIGCSASFSRLRKCQGFSGSCVFRSRLVKVWMTSRDTVRLTRSSSSKISGVITIRIVSVSAFAVAVRLSSNK